MKWGRLVPHGMCMLVSRGTPHSIKNHKENNEMEALDPAIRILIRHSISLKSLGKTMKWECVEMIENR